MQYRIEPSSGVPITRQIADQIRAQCASGILRPGAQLPSVRDLARQLTVNQNTVLRVYERLAAEGLLERRHGAGTFVCDELPSGQLRLQRRMIHEDAKRLVRRARLVGLSAADLIAWIEKAWSASVEADQTPSEKSS